MSRRMGAVHHQFAPEVEIYSIDESFLDLTGFARHALVTHTQTLRRTVRQLTGIPTCVGIDPTKTLAKLADWAAKHFPELDGVCDFTDEAVRETYLPAIDAGAMWGINAALDAVNQRYGRNTLFPAAAGIKREWSTKLEMRPSAFTTNWRELPVVRC